MPMEENEDPEFLLNFDFGDISVRLLPIRIMHISG